MTELLEVTPVRLGDSRDLLGESPYWDDATRTLCWIDALAGVLHRRHADGRTERHALPAPLGSVAPCAPGPGGPAAIVALRDGLGRYDFSRRELHVLARIEVDHPDVRLNDGKCDPWGHFITGTLHNNRREGEALLGGLYRLRAEGTLEKLADGFALTNGPCFSLDGRTLYVADSPARTVWAYDYSPDGPLGARRAFAQTDALGSGPDGATVDAQGHVWTVLPRTGQLARYTPAGQLERLLQLPVTHPTSLCFGGPGWRTAFITSISRSTHLTGPLPHDGGLFALEGLPAPGVTAARYGAGRETP